VTRDEAKQSAALAALGLEPPLRRLSQVSVDEWTVRRMWDAIQLRSAGAQERARGRFAAPAGARGRLALALLVGLLGTGLLLTGLLGTGLLGTGLPGMEWLALRSPRTAVFQGPLVTSEGKRFESVEAVTGSAALVNFADGSHIEASPGARVEGLAATASEFVLLVRRGQARFAVTPGGPRRWLIETRGASVEVVGTVVSVESGTGFVAVQVEKGVVLVRSPLLADGVRRVSAGQALRLSTGSLSEGMERPPGTTAEDVADGLSAPEVPADSADTSQSVSSPAERPSASHSRAPRPAHGSAARLWSRADDARRAGQAARAAELLERLLLEHPGDSQAALAAYTLGVLQLEQLARPRAAAQRFRQALELGIAVGLRESCFVLRAEALRQAGDADALRRVAREYLRSYPMGEQRDAMQQLLEQSGPAKSQPPLPGERQK
jgi:transmembrane sensor